MTIKTILACLTDEKQSVTVLNAAVLLARRHSAHLIGLHTLEAITVNPGIAMHVTGVVMADFDRAEAEQADKIREIFEQRTHSEDFVSEWRLERTETTSAAARILESSRAADLVVVAQQDPEGPRAGDHDLQERLIRGSGRPVLVVPHDFDGDTVGDNVPVGWSPTREATRAAHDALTLVAPGRDVAVLTVARAGPAR